MRLIDADNMLKTACDVDAFRQHLGSVHDVVTFVMDSPDVEPIGTRLYTPHEVAEIIADLFGDECACNYNGIDEWLPKKCEFTNTCCPNPVGVACWEQWLKYREKIENATD